MQFKESEKSKTKKRIGILRGGTGEHFTSSLKKGGEIILHLRENLDEQYKPVDILVDQDYLWHMGGVPIAPGDLQDQVDLVWNISHPSFSNIIESLGIPHVGASAFSAGLKNSREMLREHMKDLGVSMPRHILFPVYQPDFDGPIEKYAIKKAKEIFEKFGAPWMVKSFTPDSSMGIHLAKTFPELINAIEDGVNHDKSILVEEFIAGKVASLHTVPGFRGEDVYVFPLGNSFGNFSSSEKEQLMSLAKQLHNHLNAKHYLQATFVLSSLGKSGKVYLTEIELNPDVKPDSHFSQACELVGAKIEQVVEHILESALR